MYILQAVRPSLDALEQARRKSRRSVRGKECKREGDRKGRRAHIVTNAGTFLDTLRGREGGERLY